MPIMTREEILKQLQKVESIYKYNLANIQNEFLSKTFFRISKLSTDISEHIKEDVLIQALDRFDDYYNDAIAKFEPERTVAIGGLNHYHLIEIILEHAYKSSIEKIIRLKDIFTGAVEQYQEELGANALSNFNNIYDLFIEILTRYKANCHDKDFKKDEKLLEIAILNYSEQGNDISLKYTVVEIPIITTTNPRDMSAYNHLIPSYIAYHIVKLNEHDLIKRKKTIEKFQNSRVENSLNKKSILQAVSRILDSLVLCNHKGLNLKMLADNDYEKGKKSLLQKTIDSNKSASNQQALNDTYTMIEQNSYDTEYQELLPKADRKKIQKQYTKMIKKSLAIYRKLTKDIFTEIESYKAMKNNLHDFSFLMRTQYDDINLISFEAIHPYDYEWYLYEEENKNIFIDYYSALLNGLKFQFLIDNMSEDNIKKFQNDFNRMRQDQKTLGIIIEDHDQMNSFSLLLKWKEWSYIYPLVYLNLWHNLQIKTAKKIAIHIAISLKYREKAYRSHEFENKFKLICEELKALTPFSNFISTKPQYFF